MKQPSYPMGKNFIWVLFILLFVLHQDIWWWNDASLVLGFMPIGLAFHAGFSIVCAILGWAAIKFAWPHDLEEFAEEDGEKEGSI
ncbi:MAG: hypothetical protein P8P49_00700 [Opitutales bacterium]|nr:hypothetical protein [Opitutales bacterium]